MAVSHCRLRLDGQAIHSVLQHFVEHHVTLPLHVGNRGLTYTAEAAVPALAAAAAAAACERSSRCCVYCHTSSAPLTWTFSDLHGATGRTVAR